MSGVAYEDAGGISSPDHMLGEGQVNMLLEAKDIEIGFGDMRQMLLQRTNLDNSSGIVGHAPEVD